jgi:hypothetical protein
MNGVRNDATASGDNTRRRSCIDDAPVIGIVPKQTFFEAKHVEHGHILNTDDINVNGCVVGSIANEPRAA